MLSLRHFRLASWRSLSLGGWWPRIRCGAVTGGAMPARPARAGAAGAGRRWCGRRRRRFRFGDIPVRGDAGARAIGANDDAAAVEVRGRRCQRPRIAKTALTSPYVVLSLRHFRLASWRSLSLGGWWPKNPARRSYGGAMPARPARAGAAGAGRRWCGRRRRRFRFGDIPVRGDAGARGDRSERRCGRCGGTGSTLPTPRDRKPR